MDGMKIKFRNIAKCKKKVLRGINLPSHPQPGLAETLNFREEADLTCQALELGGQGM